MSQTLDHKIDPVGPAPETRSIRFAELLFGASAAPLFWLGQLMLGYAVTAQTCYPGEHPHALAAGSSLGALMIAFDAVAIIAAALGGAGSFWCWQRAQHGSGLKQGRIRFLAIWGIFSSLCFFCAILFHTIASVTVPPCLI